MRLASPRGPGRGAEGMSGTVLRFGPLYGPGTSMGAGGAVLDDVSRGRIPIVGGGTGTWSLSHVEDAGRAVAAAVDHEAMTGVFHVVDDDPAPVSEWLPYLAEALDARFLWTMPTWLARPAVGGLRRARHDDGQRTGQHRDPELRLRADVSLLAPGLPRGSRVTAAVPASQLPPRGARRVRATPSRMTTVPTVACRVNRSARNSWPRTTDTTGSR